MMTRGNAVERLDGSTFNNPNHAQEVSTLTGKCMHTASFRHASIFCAGSPFLQLVYVPFASQQKFLLTYAVLHVISRLAARY